MTAKPIQVISADLTLNAHAAAVLYLLDDYAKDPAGGGQGLSDYAKSNLISAMKSRSSMFSVLAYDGDQPSRASQHLLANPWSMSTTCLFWLLTVVKALPRK